MADAELRAKLDEIFSARDREHMAPTITALGRLLEQHPNEAAVLYEVGGAYDTDGQESLAVDYYRKAIEAGLEGKWLRQCYLQYGSTLRNLGQLEESLTIFDQAVGLFPTSESLVLFRSLTLHALGKPNAALGSVLGLVADRFQTDEVLRYQTALRANADYLMSLDEMP